MSEDLTVDNAMIEEMKRITALTGRMSSFQEVHLKKWPFILFDNIQSITVDYDIIPTGDFNEEEETYTVDNRTWISFRIHFKKGTKREADFKIRCETLVNWVHFLFWNDLKVEIFINNNKKPKFTTVKKNGNNRKTKNS